MEQTTTTKVMHLRVPAELHGRVADYAAQTHRSQNSAAIVLIESAFRWADRVDADGNVDSKGQK